MRSVIIRPVEPVGPVGPVEPVGVGKASVVGYEGQFHTDTGGV